MQSSPQYQDLTNANVLITGGGSGIGACLVRNFCQQNANVAFISIDDEKSEALCTSIHRQTGKFPSYFSCDLADATALKSTLNTITEQMQNIDVLVNNAANDQRHSLNNMTIDEWDSNINVNLRPHFFTAQAVAKSMQKRQKGSIINIGSNASLLGLSGYPAYVAAKAGIVGLSKALARELGENQIRVNTVIPGWVMTEKQIKLWATPEAIKECLAQQCLKSTLSEQDIANGVLFLASSASQMITGQTLVIDGGRV